MNGVPNRYVLDTSVFTQAFRSYYHFDIAPGFWQALAQHAGAGTLLSIDRVKKEIEDGKDDLAKWIENHFHRSFESTADNQVLAAYQRVIQWAMAQGQYTDAAKAKFADADNADAWVVAYALAKDYVVVTQEVAAPQSKHNIKIPDVCRAFNVPCIDTFDMMRRLGIRL
uniref:PilT domain-containing protein n=1 Tax=uncultured Acetothermia bacterium TaxID=236499 RepID=H5SL06_9BACT|nr:PilT domain-containing protein [uncultured Acetothermia bacterium]